MRSTVPEWWFLGARIFWGIGSALIFATAFTIAADLSDSGSRGFDMGIVRGGVLLGFPSGLVLGGVVSDLFSVTIAFVVATGFAVLAGVVAFFMVPETHVSEHRTSVRPWDVNTDVATITVGLVNFGLFFAYLGALMATLVLFVGEESIYVWGYGAQGSSGFLMALTVFTSAGCMLVGGKVSDWAAARVPVLLLFLVVSFLGFVLLATAASLPVLIVACAFIGAGQGGTSGPLVALLADLTPDAQMGRAMATNNLFGDVGGALGPIASLPLIDVMGFGPIYATSAVIPLLAGMLLLAGIYARTGTVNPAVDAGH